MNHSFTKVLARTLIALLCGVLLFTATACEDPDAPAKFKGYTNTEDTTEYIRMNISYTDKNGKEQTGDVVVKMRPDVAPITVENFQTLVASDFYDGLTFHRIREGFMIQGGAPEGTGFGGAPNKIKGEFAANGVSNTLSHTRGVISMARSQSYNSASSQFFIVHEDSTSLDGQYAAFGEVVFGMDTVDGIATTPVKGETPKSTVTINYACFVTKDAE